MHINLRTQILNWNLFCIFVRHIAGGILSVCKVCSTHENKEIPTSLYHCLLFGRCICCWNVRYWLVVVQYVMYCHPMSYLKHCYPCHFAATGKLPSTRSTYFIRSIEITIFFIVLSYSTRKIHNFYRKHENYSKFTTTTKTFSHSSLYFNHFGNNFSHYFVIPFYLITK